MKGLIAYFVCIFLLSTVAQAQAKPNIILIVDDDLGYGDLGRVPSKLPLTMSICAGNLENVCLVQMPN